MAKVKTLHSFFPDAVILNINRCPSKTIPSTIQLNNSIYKFFSSQKASVGLEQRTAEILVNWYKMSHRYLQQYNPDQVLEIDFNKLVKGEEDTVNQICLLLNLGPVIFLQKGSEKSVRNSHVSNNQYKKLTEVELARVLSELPFLAAYCSEQFNKQSHLETASVNVLE